MGIELYMTKWAQSDKMDSFVFIIMQYGASKYKNMIDCDFVIYIVNEMNGTEKERERD